MAIEIFSSGEVAASESPLAEAAAAYRYWPAEGAKVRLAHFTFVNGTTVGADGSSVNLVKLPAGRVRVLPGLSRIAVSALGASRVMDLGHRAYVASDGKTAVAASLNDFVDDRDVSSATDSNFGTDVKKDYFSASGITICALITGGALDAAETMEGYVAYEIVQ